MQNIWCECLQRNNKVLDFLLIQIHNTCCCRIRWERSLNCITSSIVTTLPEDYLLFINLCFYAVFFCFFVVVFFFFFFFFLLLFFFFFFFCFCFFLLPFLLPLYYSDGDIFLVLFRQRLILAVSPIFSFTSLSLTVFASPDNRFCKMLLSTITFVIDVDISLYSSLHSVENV